MRLRLQRVLSAGKLRQGPSLKSKDVLSAAGGTDGSSKTFQKGYADLELGLLIINDGANNTFTRDKCQVLPLGSKA